jgi:hypothetical protein
MRQVVVSAFSDVELDVLIMHLVGEYRNGIDGGERGDRRDNSSCVNYIREVIANRRLTMKLLTAIFLLLEEGTILIA